MANQQQGQQRQDKDVDMDVDTDRGDRSAGSADDTRGMDTGSDRDVGMRGDNRGR